MDCPEETRTTTTESSETVEGKVEQHRRYNDSLPINRLPPELLLEIFFIFAKYILLYRRNVSPANLSFVCFHWRQILLNCTSFWGYIITLNSSPQWIEVLLSRSKDANIHINGPFRLGASFPLLFQQFRRLQSIDVTSVDPTDDFFDVWLQQPAPCLERLSISLNTSLVPVHQYGTLVIPDSLFSRHAPSLRHIVLRNVIFRFPHVSVLQNLFSLSVQGYKRKFGPSVNEWLEALGHMPFLQDLRLLEGSLSSEGIVDDELPYASLPELKRLYIIHQPHVLSTMLDHLYTPLGCSLLLRTTDLSTQKDMAFANAIRNLKETLLRFTRAWSAFRTAAKGTIRWMFTSFQCIHVTLEFSSLPINVYDDTVFSDQRDAFNTSQASLCLEIYDLDRDLFQPFIDNFTCLLKETGLQGLIEFVVIQYYRFPVEMGHQFIGPILLATPSATTVKVRESDAVRVILEYTTGNIMQDTLLPAVNHFIFAAEYFEDSQLEVRNATLLLGYQHRVSRLTLHSYDGENVKSVIEGESEIYVEVEWNNVFLDE